MKFSATKSCPNAHIDAITRKTNSIICFLDRNLGHCTHILKETAETIFVRPCVEYASCTWDPHTQRNICKLEQVQCSCACFVAGDCGQLSSVSAMLEASISQFRETTLQSCLTMMFKIHQEDQYSVHLLPHEVTTLDSGFPWQTNLSVYTMSFPRTIWGWNNPQKDPVVYSSLDSFKAVLRDPLLM